MEPQVGEFLEKLQALGLLPQMTWDKGLQDTAALVDSLSGEFDSVQFYQWRVQNPPQVLDRSLGKGELSWFAGAACPARNATLFYFERNGGVRELVKRPLTSNATVKGRTETVDLHEMELKCNVQYLFWNVSPIEFIEHMIE
jgi:hypothetical protein